MFFRFSFFNRLTFIVTILVVCFILVIIQLRFLCIEMRKKLIEDFYDATANNDSYEYYLDINFRTQMVSIDSILSMKKQIKEINEKQMVHNQKHFGAVDKCAFVIVVQVHDNIFYLKEHLWSLSNVVGIQKCLLIFPHDHFNQDINQLIRNVTFANYMQIFYPYTYQLHPKVFPGLDVNFCTDGFKCDRSKGERDPILIQKKQHWWWQANQVFDHVNAVNEYNDYVIFLKENQIVAEDLLYVLSFVEQVKTETCPQCELISFGAYLPNVSQYHVKTSFISIETWNSDLYNIGIAFNRTIWEIMKKHREHFCYFNDFRWANSLKYSSTFTSRGKFLVLATEPRVFEIAECDGFNSSCVMGNEIRTVKTFVRRIQRGFYPSGFELKHINDVAINITEGGDFTDVRDREICMYVSKERNILIM